MGNKISNLEDGVRVEFSVAGSQDRLPYILVDPAGANNAYRVIGATNLLTDLTYEVREYAPTANQTFDITATSNDVVVKLAATGGVNAAAAQISSDSADNLGKLDLAADFTGTAGNDLTVVITNPGPNDCALVCSMGGTGNNVLTIALGRTGASTDSTKNTITLIAAAINAIVTNKKITATGSGTQSRKITQTATSAPFTSGADSSNTAITATALVAQLNDEITWTTLDGVVTAEVFARDAEGATPNTGAGAAASVVAQTPFTDPTLTGTSFSRGGYDEILVILTLGMFEALSTLTVTIEGSDDDVTFTAITDAVWTDLDYTASMTQLTGVLRVRANELPQYIRAVSEVDGDWVEHSVVFILGGGQYSEVTTDHTFVV